MPKTPAVLTRLAQAKEAGLQETGLHSKSLGPSAKVIPAPPAQATPRQPVTGGAAGPGAKGQGASETPGDGKAVAAAEAVPMPGPWQWENKFSRAMQHRIVGRMCFSWIRPSVIGPSCPMFVRFCPAPRTYWTEVQTEEGGVAGGGEGA